MLNPDELRTLDAAMERIVPPDDEVGALAAGVGEYVRGRATLDVDRYRAGIALLDARGFANLGAAAQDAVLTELEGHPLILLMIQHTMEGYYTSEAGFRTVGFRVTA